jgi:hypothetical protein
MKPIFTRVLSILLAAILYQTAVAGTTYPITASVSSSYLGADGFSSCPACTFNLSPGVIFTINTGGTCTGCTFNGGTVVISSSSTVAWDGVTTFNNGALQINNTTTFQGIALTNDSLQVNSNLTLATNASTISGSHIELNNDTITATKSVTATNSFFALNDTSEYYMNGGALTLTGSTMYLNDDSYIYANSQLIMQTGSAIYIGDGTTASAAYLYYNTSTALDIVGSSMIKVLNTANYYFNWHDYNYYVTSTTGAAAPYAGLATPYTYGCAILNKNGSGSCAVLAISEIDLTAVAAGTNAAALTWSDPQSSTAGSYEVQRSTGNSSWATITTIDADAGTASYHYEDASAPAGTDDYRIVRIDQHGASSYSIISSVTIATAAAAGNIRLYPNPATGHTFFITTPDTQQLIISIFTVTGQLLSRQSLQGQTQYQLLLPSQLLPGNAVIVQVISPTVKQAFPLLLQ